ncbi:hypothetical protein QR680_009694 [Steinernema hermaphroditum]|uniref:Uncharacterized protein n=1 Tax=Steinernema hermaphroditum TaxID=289476 RepID=A0AA39INR9_9BILA|nr:hypothetical protein QR680_009694 [Steinernema hermaphroditum]
MNRLIPHIHLRVAGQQAVPTAPVPSRSRAERAAVVTMKRSTSVPPRGEKNPSHSKPQRSKSKAPKREKPDAKRRSLRAAPAEGTSEPAKGAEVWSSPFDERPPFDLDTRIEGYEDVDENGRYRRRGGPRKVKVDRHKQEELNQQWADSLRE